MLPRNAQKVIAYIKETIDRLFEDRSLSIEYDGNETQGVFRVRFSINEFSNRYADNFLPGLQEIGGENFKPGELENNNNSASFTLSGNPTLLAERFSKHGPSYELFHPDVDRLYITKNF